jgi:hypothetical protein
MNLLMLLSSVRIAVQFFMYSNASQELCSEGHRNASQVLCSEGHRNDETKYPVEVNTTKIKNIF